MRIATLLLGWLLFQAQTLTPAQQSAQWFSQHLSPARSSDPFVRPAPLPQPTAPLPQPHALITCPLTACTADSQILPLYEWLARTESSSSMRSFDLAQANGRRADMATRNC